MLETLDCVGATCDPIVGPIYYGWTNGWVST